MKRSNSIVMVRSILIFFLHFFSLSVSVSVFSDESQWSDSDVEKNKNACYLSATVEQRKVIKNLPNALTSKGKMLYSCNHGLVWHTTEPVSETLLYSVGRTHYRVVDATKPVPLKGSFHRYMAKVLIAMIGMDQIYIERYFATLESHRDNVVERHVFKPKKNPLRRRVDTITLTKTADKVSVVLRYPSGEMMEIYMSQIRFISVWDKSWCDAELSRILSCDFFCSAAGAAC